MTSYVSNIVVCHDGNDSPDKRIIDFTHKLRVPLDNVKSIIVKHVWCIPQKISVNTAANNDIIRVSIDRCTHFLRLNHGAYHIYEYLDEIQKRMDEHGIPITLKIQSCIRSCPDRDGRIIRYDDSFLRMSFPLMKGILTISEVPVSVPQQDPDMLPLSINPSFGSVFGEIFDSAINMSFGEAHIDKVITNDLHVNLKYDQTLHAFKGFCTLAEQATLLQILLDIPNTPGNVWSTVPVGTNGYHIENGYQGRITVINENVAMMGTNGTYADLPFELKDASNNTYTVGPSGLLTSKNEAGLEFIIIRQNDEYKKIPMNGGEIVPCEPVSNMILVTPGSSERIFIDGAGNELLMLTMEFDNFRTGMYINSNVSDLYTVLPKGSRIDFTFPYDNGLFPVPSDLPIIVQVQTRVIYGTTHVKTKEAVQEPMGLILRCPEIESYVWQNRNHNNEGVAYFQYQERLHDQRTWQMTDDKSFSTTAPRFDRLSFWFQGMDEEDNMFQSKKRILHNMQIRILLGICFDRPFLDPRSHIGYLNPHIREDTTVRDFGAFGSQEQDTFENLIASSRR